VAVTAAVAFAAGSITGPAGATAARLTKARVEKIVAGVIDEKATTLHVAHARTADSARDSSTLAGRGPAAYGTSVVAVSSGLFRTPMVTEARWILHDVPMGTYLLTYHLAVETSVPNALVTCYIGSTNPGAIGSSAAGVGRSSDGTVTGSLLVTRTATSEPVIGCGALEGMFQVRQPKDQLTEVHLVRVDDVTPASVETVIPDFDRP